MSAVVEVVFCGEKSDSKESRPWWEPPYVIYGFSNPRVRSKLERLVGTYVVRVTDKEFMMMLHLREREDHEETMRKKIHDRELAEVEREKKLILEGKMPVEEAPEELSNHPVFKITQLARKILEEKKRREEEKKIPKKTKTFNYGLLRGREEENVEDTDLISCIDDDGFEDIDDKTKLALKEAYLSEAEEFTDEDYMRIKYEDPLVEELRYDVDAVDELYELADEIVGPLTGRKICGGLIRFRQ